MFATRFVVLLLSMLGASYAVPCGGAKDQLGLSYWKFLEDVSAGIADHNLRPRRCEVASSGIAQVWYENSAGQNVWFQAARHFSGSGYRYLAVRPDRNPERLTEYNENDYNECKELMAAICDVLDVAHDFAL